MSSNEPGALPESARLLNDLFDAMDAIRVMPDDLDAPEVRTLESRIAQTVDKVARVAGRPKPSRGDVPPPRPVAVAMAMAVASQPHLSITVGGSEDEVPLLIGSEALEHALGLPRWEIEDLREEIDRRAGLVLKQSRALRWLRSHLEITGDDDGAGFRALLPGLERDLETCGFESLGTRLYARIAAPAPPTASLYLGWTVDPQRSFSPLETFQSRYVDVALRRALARAIGADEEEVAFLLDNMVLPIPVEAAETFLAHDAWRHDGYADLTSLGAPYGGTAWLTQPLVAERVDWTAWLKVDGEDIAPDNARAAFDHLAMPRLTALVRQLYAEMLAGLHAEGTIPPYRQRALFDVETHVDVALQPLLRWIGQPTTITWLARTTGVDAARVRAALEQVREDWSLQARHSWGGRPSAERMHSVQSLFTTHLAVSQASLHRLYHQPADSRAPHKQVLKLFAGHYFAQAQLGRLWMSPDGTLPPIEDVAGQWFWPTWMRVLNAAENND